MTFNEQTLEQQDQHITPVLEISQAGDVLVACTSAAWPLIELLENFAEVAGVSDGRLRYRLTPASLGEALSRGLHPAYLLDQLHHALENRSVGATLAVAHDSLARNSQDSFAHDLLVSLERRIANYGRVRLYTDASLLEVADTQVKRELSATTSLEKQVLRTLSPTLFVLKQQGAESLLEELKRRGQAPLLHEGRSHGTK
jgi:hypothetical protein